MALRKVTVANTVLGSYRKKNNYYLFGRKFRGGGNATEFSITFFDSQIWRYNINVSHICPAGFTFTMESFKGKTTYK